MPWSLGDLVYGVRAGEQQDLLGLERLRDPHLSAVEPVLVRPSSLSKVVIRDVYSTETGFGDTASTRVGRRLRSGAASGLEFLRSPPPAPPMRATGCMRRDRQVDGMAPFIAAPDRENLSAAGWPR